MNAIHPLTTTAVQVHAMLTGGFMGRERYRLTRILLSRAEAGYVMEMVGECERIMNEREKARRRDAELAAGRR